MAAQEEKEKPAKAVVAKPRKKPLSRTANTGQVPAAAQAFTATEPKSILDDVKASKGAIQPNAALQKPASASKPNAGGIAAKPTAQSATAAPPTGAKPAVTPKPAAAVNAKQAAPASSAKVDAKQPEKKPQVAAETKPKAAAKVKTE
jgi:hypothetical protein